MQLEVLEFFLLTNAVCEERLVVRVLLVRSAGAGPGGLTGVGLGLLVGVAGRCVAG